MKYDEIQPEDGQAQTGGSVFEKRANSPDTLSRLRCCMMALNTRPHPRRASSPLAISIETAGLSLKRCSQGLSPWPPRSRPGPRKGELVAACATLACAATLLAPAHSPVSRTYTSSSALCYPTYTSRRSSSATREGRNPPPRASSSPPRTRGRNRSAQGRKCPSRRVRAVGEAVRGGRACARRLTARAPTCPRPRRQGPLPVRHGRA